MHEIHTDNFDPNLCSNEPTTTERPSSFRVCTTGNDGMQPVGSPILGNIDETNFSYNVSLQWSPTDDSMYYASTSTGFKSGGFDLRGAGDPANFIFDEEESTNYEIGGRHTLAGNTVRLNWTLYSTNIEGLQLSSNDPATITQTVVNGEATAEGLEWDLVWAASDNLNLSFAGAYLDATYDNFLAACYTRPFQTTATGCDIDLNGVVGPIPPGHPDATVSSGGNVRRAALFGTYEEAQNLAGQTLAFAPEWQAVAGADYTWNLAGGRDLRAALALIYMDDHSTMIDNNPAGFQDAFTKIDASLTLLGGDGKWWVALIGKNLTDELVYHFTSGTTTCARGNPAVVPGGTTSCLFTTVEETRAIGIRAQYNFR
jgi:outer membrane receptor protein involved in Fe transport